MATLSNRDKELVSIGAAIASNCVPCIANHVELSRKYGLSDDEIREAVRLAEVVKTVPADMVRKTAYSYLDSEPGPSMDKADEDSSTPDCCG